jgi:hypothetical protein
MKSKHKRGAVLAACIALTLAGVMYFFYPNPLMHSRQVSGVAQEYQSCRSKSSCKASVQIGDLKFSCRADPLGASNSCPAFYLVDEKASAEYYLQPSVLTLLLGTSDTPVLIKFEQRGRVVYQASYQDIQDGYLWPGSMLLIVIFGCLFGAIQRHSYFTKKA